MSTSLYRINRNIQGTLKRKLQPGLVVLTYFNIIQQFKQLADLSQPRCVLKSNCSVSSSLAISTADDILLFTSTVW